jgi:hypothetical protein
MANIFEADAFISYAHLDNIELIEGRKGWVANLYRALDVRVAQLLGKDAQIWWDPKLQGNDYFADTLGERLQRVAALVAVVSPRYVKSEWGRKELAIFCEAAHRQVGLRIGDKSRIFKVLKTPVAVEEHPPELEALLGYEFFRIDQETGKVRELDEIFGPDAQREFWLKLDDLAHDLCATLKLLNAEALATEPPREPSATVYLAVTTGELKDEWLAIKRDLEQHGYAVLPDRPLPLDRAQATEHVRADLERSQLSVHLVGSTYSLVPEGGRESLIELQHELAVQRSARGQFVRLVWIPPGLKVDDDRQERVIQSLRMDPRTRGNADLLETPLEDLRTVITSWLDREPETDRKPPAVPGSDSPPQLYLLYDRRDQAAVLPWADYLFKERFEVLHPLFEGDESDIREYHEENLRACAAALIFYGSANEAWLRRKLRELQKSVGYGRSTIPVVAVGMIGDKTPEKERFRTHEAMLIPLWSGLSPELLQPFMDRVRQASAPASRDGASDPT